ncbi:cache domain-containing protein [Paracoccus simplex]|uniref:histidine kinase n=1 Tax=Paracoccus simplex TaxID=2086346 RepID=A0ABV7S0I5_9RHOB
MKKSLGASLAVGMAGLQFLAILLVVFSSYVTSERALIRHARDLLRDVGINTIEHSKGFLSPAQGAAELAAQLAQNRVIASHDTPVLEQLLFQQLKMAPQFAGLYYGREDGTFVMVMRSPDGRAEYRSKIISIENGKRRVELIWRDATFAEVGRQLDPTDTYDPRDRPWYVKACKERRTIWTDPYIFFSSQQPGITLAAPVLHENGRVRGAVGVDIEISMISEFLSRLNIGQHGRALIINHNGDVIAHPDASLIKTRSADGTLRFADIRELGDPIARAAFGPLALAGALPVQQETPSQFDYQGASYVSTIMPVISDKLPWTIAVYAPENDFTGVLKKNRTLNIWLAVLVAGLTGLIGLALADYIHRPVRAFAVRTALISQGELDPDAPLPRTYKELGRANDALVQQIVARRKTEREYGQTFNMSSRGMAQIQPDSGRFIRVNARICEMTGYSARDLTQMRLRDLFHPDDPTFVGAIFNTDDSDFAVNREIRCIRKDGSTIWITLNEILIRDEHGKPLHAVLTMDDITQNKRAETQILQLNRDLSHLARGKTMSQMAAGLAHELNQPLTAIAQNADTALLILNEQPDGPPPALHDLRTILAEIEGQSLRAGEIIRALRGFISKDEGGSTALDLAPLIEQTLRLVQAEATEARVGLQTLLDPDLPPVRGNRVQVAQVIVNLLRNAIEALAPDPAADRRVILRAARDGGMVRIAVEDTGPGIAPGINLFSQFETTKSDGMGLGLSICRSIVEANGGTLWHETLPGRGSRFLFTLPVHAHG